jgi:uncharacterized protein
MITILSPAKTLNMEKINNNPVINSKGAFVEEAALLIDELRKYSPPELERLLKINSELAETNYKRHVSWQKDHNVTKSKQALLAYHGMVYQGLDAETLERESLFFAQDHLRILSGLYGVLRPLDLIQPYRLEMGIKLNNILGKDLYAFWKERITSYFIEELNKHSDNTLVNLASNEYSSAIDMKKLKGKIITPVFKDYKNGTYKAITIYAKKARGMMTRFIIENHVDNPEELKSFDGEGYKFCEYMSNDGKLVFLRG